jgi:hypothetical protein
MRVIAPNVSSKESLTDLYNLLDKNKETPIWDCAKDFKQFFNISD